ncbi:hypothetical protein [Marinomonas phage CPP1m]|uniref:Uncharacterized protein n=2 Tax=Murciavirus CPP1m TaxID=2733327 RepID=A0A1W5S8S7_9CAUD|nr:hypothetical protein HOR72_gp20 [Marinomonas phage CPP1m]ARB11239.1 hypothetical protein [Marinomonas phage CPP1m]ARB11289.1 hypothetical protein [Marinomonas phage CPG1g]
MYITSQDVYDVVQHCAYKEGWRFIVNGSIEEGTLYLQIEVANARCSVSGLDVSWKSGKRYISEYACKQEVVGALLALIKDAEMHEVHEMFRYKGSSIYNPHLCPDALSVLASKKENFVVRVDGDSMNPK